MRLNEPQRGPMNTSKAYWESMVLNKPQVMIPHDHLLSWNPRAGTYGLKVSIKIDHTLSVLGLCLKFEKVLKVLKNTNIANDVLVPFDMNKREMGIFSTPRSAWYKKKRRNGARSKRMRRRWRVSVWRRLGRFQPPRLRGQKKKQRWGVEYPTSWTTDWKPHFGQWFSESSQSAQNPGL